jgi:hypothetical protein
MLLIADVYPFYPTVLLRLLIEKKYYDGAPLQPPVSSLNILLFLLLMFRTIVVELKPFHLLCSYICIFHMHFSFTFSHSGSVFLKTL